MQRLLVGLAMVVIIAKLKPINPGFLMKIIQHLLLQFVLAVVNTNRVVVTIQTVYQSLNRGSLQMTQIRSCLSWLLAQNHHVGVDQAESINDHLAYYTKKKHEDI